MLKKQPLFSFLLLLQAAVFGIKILKELTQQQKIQLKNEFKRNQTRLGRMGTFPVANEDGTRDWVFYKKSSQFDSNFRNQIITEKLILKHLKQKGYKFPPYLLDSYLLDENDSSSPLFLVTSLIQPSFGNFFDAWFYAIFYRSINDNPEILKNIFFEIALNLNEIHKAGVIHLDIKPENIIIADENEPVIIDFGISLILEQYKKDPKSYLFNHIPISPNYAPGYFDGVEKTVGEKYDWFSYGRTLLSSAYVLRDRKHSFRIENGISYSLNEFKKFFLDKDFADLVYHLTRPKYDDRLDFEGIKNHPYFKDLKISFNSWEEEIQSFNIPIGTKSLACVQEKSSQVQEKTLFKISQQKKRTWIDDALWSLVPVGIVGLAALALMLVLRHKGEKSQLKF